MCPSPPHIGRVTGGRGAAHSKPTLLVSISGLQIPMAARGALGTAFPRGNQVSRGYNQVSQGIETLNKSLVRKR